MSEPIPESVPTSQDPRSKRPLKRRALTPVSEQATQIDSLFKDPAREIRIPNISKPRTSASLAPPPEIVANVQGSSAGAGSGEFHVYKASRRREYERMRLMEEELKTEKSNEEFERKREEARRKDEAKTEKNRRKREKRKAAKEKNAPAATKKHDEGISADEDMAIDTSPSQKPYLPVSATHGDMVVNSNKPSQTDHSLHQNPGDGGVIIHDDD